MTEAVMAEVAITVYQGISPVEQGVVSTASPNQMCEWKPSTFPFNGFQLVA